MSDYKPQPDSVPAKAIAHMRSSEAGTHFNAAELGKACGCLGQQVHAGLASAIARGVVMRTKDHDTGDVHFYLPEDGSEDRPRQSVVAAADAPPLTVRGHSSIFALATAALSDESTEPPATERRKQTAKPPPAPAAEAPGLGWKAPTGAPKPKAVREPRSKVMAVAVRSAPASAPEAAQISCAMFNTGDLLLELPQQPAIRLNREQTRALVGYLQTLDLLARSAIERATS